MIDFMATLTPQRQREIDSVVESISLNTGLSYPENGLLEIANALGVKVVELELESSLNGAVQYRNEKEEHEPIIILNKNYPPPRKTFTLAHELGHFMLHKGEERLRLDQVNYSAEDSAKETEANYFAASLLVPKTKLIKILRVADNVDNTALARYFGVSKPVIENRLKWLATN